MAEATRLMVEQLRAWASDLQTGEHGGFDGVLAGLIDVADDIERDLDKEDGDGTELATPLGSI